MNTSKSWCCFVQQICYAYIPRWQRLNRFDVFGSRQITQYPAQPGVGLRAIPFGGLHQRVNHLTGVRTVRARLSHVFVMVPLWQCWPDLWIWRQPAMRQQFADLTVLVRGQTSQHILQIGIRVMPIEFGTLNQTHHCRRTLSRT